MTWRVRPRRVSDDAGFTLIEVLVAALIFAVVATGAVVAAIGGVQSTDDSRNRTTATNIAQTDLEQARAVPTPTAASYSTAPTPGGQSYGVVRTVTAPNNCAAGQERQISVTVSWANSHSLTQDTVVAC